MLARLYYWVPFTISVPRDAVFAERTYEYDGYTITEYPPHCGEQPLPQAPQCTAIDKRPSYESDTIRIDFKKDNFERSMTALFDPPSDVLTAAVTRFVRRLRYANRGFAMVSPSARIRNFMLKYTNDDGTDLPQQDGQRLWRMGNGGPVAVSPCTEHEWKAMATLPPDFEPPVWFELHLDAIAALPHVGSAIVLAATALERFIKDTTDRLGSSHVKPPELWKWLVTQKVIDKRPSIEDLYDVLLKFFTGHSLREEPELWSVFMSIKTARNKFVHEGVAKVVERIKGQDTLVPLTEVKASELLSKLNMVIAKVRSWLPPEMQWPVFDFNHLCEVRFAVPKKAGGNEVMMVGNDGVPIPVVPVPEEEVPGYQP